MNVYTDSEIDQIARQWDEEEEKLAIEAADELEHAMLSAFAKWTHASPAIQLGLTMHDVMAAMRWPDQRLASNEALAKLVTQFSEQYGWSETLRVLARAMDTYGKKAAA